MKLFKKIISFNRVTPTDVERELFKENGDVILTPESCYLMDAILAIVMVKSPVLLPDVLHLELFHCGIYVSYPELKKVLRYMQKDGVIHIAWNLN